MIEDSEFRPYKRGSGRLADAALARIGGDDEWTRKDLRAAKLLKWKNKARGFLRGLIKRGKRR